MLRSDVAELHYITPIVNVASILAHGLLSHRRAAALAHTSVSDDDVQSLRAGKTVPPSGKPLHDFVNLFFHARNSMMYVRQGMHDQLAVLRISTDVLSISGAIVADRNAAAAARFDTVPTGLARLDKALVFARSWDHADDLEKLRRKQIRSAEVLVPNHVPAIHVTGAWVSCEAAKSRLTAVAPTLQITINADLFFR